MAKRAFETGKAPLIEVSTIMGDLTVREWDGTQVMFSGDGEVSETKAGLAVSGSGDVKLTVPAASTLQIGSIHGDAAIRGVVGDVSINEIMGDAAAADVGLLRVGMVHGDFAARDVVGALSLEEVFGDMAVKRAQSVVAGVIHGDLAVRRLEGALTVTQVMGDAAVGDVKSEVRLDLIHQDVSLSAVEGPLMLGHVHGDAALTGPLAVGKHTIAADGDIVIRWPTDRPVEISATGSKISNRLPLEDVKSDGVTLSGRIGEGGPLLNVTTHGRLVLRPVESSGDEWSKFGEESGEAFAGKAGFDFGREIGMDPEAFAAQIRRQVEEGMRKVSKDLEAKLGPEFGQRIAEQMSRKAEKVASKAERAAEKAQRRSERWPGGATMTQSAPAQAAPRAADTTAEQMKILKMVEDGTITPDEANMLLSALEG